MWSSAAATRGLAVQVHWTTYGSPAYTTLRRVLAEAQKDDPLSAVTLIVPSNVAGLAARRTLARVQHDSGTGVAGLTVLTLDRFAEQVAAPSLVSAGRRPVTSAALASAWRTSLASNESLFDTVREHATTV